MQGTELYELAKKDITKAYDFIASIMDDYQDEGLYPSVGCGQAGVESRSSVRGEFGSLLAQDGNNLFGYKGKYNGNGYTAKTRERGTRKRLTKTFKQYPDIETGIRDYCRLMCSGKYKRARLARSAYYAIYHIAKAGYAGSRSYAYDVYERMQEDNLFRYDTKQLPSDKRYRLIYNSIRKGSRGAYVERVQQWLSVNDYEVGTIDGIFGRKTKKAVMKFQKDNGLKVDGIFGKKSHEVMFKEF